MIKIANNLVNLIKSAELPGPDWFYRKSTRDADAAATAAAAAAATAKELKELKKQHEMLNKNYIQDDAIAGGLGGLALGGLGGAAYEHFRAPNEDGSEKDYLKSILMGSGIGLGVGGLGGAAYGSRTGEGRKYESAKAEMKANKKWNLDENNTKQEEESAKTLRKSLEDPQTKIKNQKQIDDLKKSMDDKAKATKAK